jgi:hypothetical protein
MMYLADWRSALTHDRQLTDIQWVFDYLGPDTDDVIDAIRNDPEFDIALTSDQYGDETELIRLSRKPDLNVLGASERLVLQFVIDQTSLLQWDRFLQLVFSTYPVRSQPRHTQLDLVRLAQELQSGQSGAVSRTK